MRYCSVNLPYDLTDEELIAPIELRDRAIARLDKDGWNTDGQLGRQTWARVKLLVNSIREDVLELSLAPAGAYADPKRKAQ
jgi:chromatin structure-remodeling complex subunit RSC3/30